MLTALPAPVHFVFVEPSVYATVFAYSIGVVVIFYGIQKLIRFSHRMIDVASSQIIEPAVKSDQNPQSTPSNPDDETIESD